MTSVTQILEALQHGDPAAANQLLPLVYDELRKLAAQRMSGEPTAHSLQATDLVHEAFVRLVDVEEPQCWNSRGHFFCAAAEAMRRILIESARRKQRIRHGGELNQQAVNWDDIQALDLPANESEEELIALDAALDKLREQDGTAADLVQLRYFAGLTQAEAAEILNISTRTADRTWAYAKSWLHREILRSKSESR